MSTAIPTPTLDHLRRLTDEGGLYEHALLTVARPEHGYCVDDVARGLVVLAREAPGDADLTRLYLDFVLQAQSPDGRFRNRRAADLTWSGTPSVEDCWGRALWGLGAVVAGRGSPDLRRTALAAFERGAGWRSPWPRARAFAALGAAAVLDVHPDSDAARGLLADAAQRSGALGTHPGWLWSEDRLTYANAVVPEVLLAAGHHLGEPAMTADGLALLAWLLEVQTRDGRLSVVPVGGRGPGDAATRFDQQPIEVAALADACARAFAVTEDPRWSDAVRTCADWFLGANDAATSLLDVVSGGGCDGLEHDGRNENQGAESTLALLSTLQQAHALTAAT